MRKRHYIVSQTFVFTPRRHGKLSGITQSKEMGIGAILTISFIGATIFTLLTLMA